METRKPPSIWQKAITWLGFERWGMNAAGEPTSTSTVSALQSSGERVALSVSTVYSCTTLYSGLYSSLPLEVHKGSEANASRTIDNHPLVELLNLSPNAEQTAADFFEFVGFSLELWQNAYIQKQRIGARVVGLLPLHPSTIRAVRTPAGLRYQGHSEGQSFDLPADDVIHIRGAGGAVLGARPLLDVARDAIQFSREAQLQSTALLANGMRPSGVMSVDEKLTAPQRTLIEEPLLKKFMGAMNAGRPLLLDGGAKFVPLSIDPEKAQMLESRGFSVEDICRFWGVPPIWVGHTEKQTSFGTGVEQQLLGFIMLRLNPRIRKIELALSRGLLKPEERAQGLMIRFQMDDLKRGDTAARSAFYKVGRETSFLTANEIRGWEGLPPVPGGDTLEAPAYARMAGTQAPAAE